MTKMTTKIAERYENYYKAWLSAFNKKAPYEKQEKLLISVYLLESILVNDCNLGYNGVAKLRDKAFDEYYVDLVK